MKLCALTQSYAPTGGGVRTMLHAERDWFREHGHEHILIVPGDQDTVTRDGALTTCTVRSPLVPGSNVYRLLLRSDKVLRILRDEMPDVIETHCAYNLPWAALRHRNRHGGIVSAVYMTDLPVAYVEAPLSRSLARVAGERLAHGTAARARSLTERYLRALYGRCDVVAAISPVMRGRLLEFGVRNVQLVPLGVDLDTFSPMHRDGALRATLDVGGGDDVRGDVGGDVSGDVSGDERDELLLVYAGRLDGEKRPDLVLDAFARVREHLPRAALVIAGDGPMREALAARGDDVGRVHVLPFIDRRDEMARLLASADVYVSGMAHETFGLSVVEAQACGLPVVGMRAGAMTDRVREGVDGFLVAAHEPDTAAQMAARIVATPADVWPEMGRRARERVTAEFSWNRTFETLTDLYTTALAAR